MLRTRQTRSETCLQLIGRVRKQVGDVAAYGVRELVRSQTGLRAAPGGQVRKDIDNQNQAG
eukprot:3536107-Alexandrium_andersonii.AAC.1